METRIVTDEEAHILATREESHFLNANRLKSRDAGFKKFVLHLRMLMAGSF